MWLLFPQYFQNHEKLFRQLCQGADDLEVPTTYESYTELSSEFTNILKEEQSWSFDII